MTTKLYREIGGYFSLESQAGHYNCKGIALNSGRNAMRYIIRAYGVNKIAVPYYTCPVIWEVLREENIEVFFYHIDEELEILGDFSADIFVLANNYFGVKGSYIKNLAKKYSNLIVDDAQSLYAPKVGLAHFNSPRKFFGLADGGFAICDKEYSEPLQKDFSYARCSHLLIRADNNVSKGYQEFQKNDLALSQAPFAYMSSLTKQMTSNIDYSGAKAKRIENFDYLHKALISKNDLNINLDANDVPMSYPFLIKDDCLRRRLIENKIFVATYWPGIEQTCKDGFELYLQKYLLPLPVDQRYKKEDMKIILEVLGV